MKKMKLYKQLDATIKGKSIETITKKWNKILKNTNDEDFLNWMTEGDNICKIDEVQDCGCYTSFEWIEENECYVWINLYK